MYRLIGKRLFDLFSASIGLILLSPVFLFVAIAIKKSSPGPVFYTQIRMGKDFKPFRLYKFRSMVTGADKKGPSVTSSDDNRITPIGKFIRKTKLDELPQLINVVKGEMSIVGPRPEVEKFARAKAADYMKVLSVKPGITDYAAIEYVDEEAILAGVENREEVYIDKVLPEKIALYFKYIDNISFVTDLKLIFATIGKIIR